MRPKWVAGIAIGVFFLYVSFYGISALGLTMYPSRTTNLKAGMSWSTSESQGEITCTYTISSVVGSVVSVQEIGGVTASLVFDVTNTTVSSEPVVIASGLGVGDELFDFVNPNLEGTGNVYCGSIDTSTVLGKNLLVASFHLTLGSLTIPFTIKYFQDSGVEYRLDETLYSTPMNQYLCTTSDPVTGGTTTYTITPSAGVGGSINPPSVVTLSAGSNQKFTITADSGYSISDVSVDGSPVGLVSSYTFTNVEASHTISTSFSHNSVGSPSQIHLTAIYNGNPVSATLNIIFPDGHQESPTTPYDNTNAPTGAYTVSAVYQDKVISSYAFTLGSGDNFVHTFDFGTGSPVNTNYILLIIEGFLKDSQLMLLVGGSITGISGIMLFVPKSKPQYS